MGVRVRVRVCVCVGLGLYVYVAASGPQVTGRILFPSFCKLKNKIHRWLSFILNQNIVTLCVHRFKSSWMSLNAGGSCLIRFGRIVVLLELSTTTPSPSESSAPRSAVCSPVCSLFPGGGTGQPAFRAFYTLTVMFKLNQLGSAYVQILPLITPRNVLMQNICRNFNKRKHNS